MLFVYNFTVKFFQTPSEICAKLYDHMRHFLFLKYYHVCGCLADQTLCYFRPIIWELELWVLLNATSFSQLITNKILTTPRCTGGYITVHKVLSSDVEHNFCGSKLIMRMVMVMMIMMVIMMMMMMMMTMKASVCFYCKFKKGNYKV